MKEKLLQALSETRRREADLVAMCTDAPPDPSGRWRPQDHLAHMSWNREFHASVIEAARTHTEPPPDPGEGGNDAYYEANKDRPTDEVKAEADRSWDRIDREVRASTEEVLAEPHPYDPRGRRLVDMSPGDHLAAHLFWCHIEAGDEKNAEEILRWAQDLSERTSTDPRAHAVGVYNLACFYARTSRVEEALPLLAGSFVEAPDLKEWAHKDPDLDPIRDVAEFRELLG